MSLRQFIFFFFSDAEGFGNSRLYLLSAFLNIYLSSESQENREKLGKLRVNVIIICIGLKS